VSPGPLAEPHADIDGITGCTQCHVPGRFVDPARCLACHEEVQEEIDTKKGFHAQRDSGCHECHSDHRGREFDLIRVAEDTFPHDDVFPLRGKHADAECTDCHEEDTWEGLTTDCASCHADEEPHGAAESSRELLNSCELCHGDADWEVESIPSVVFDHTNAAQTAFTLEGGHLDPTCAECHVDARFVPTAHDECLDCHDDPHRAPFDDQCESCHNVAAWRVSAFEHSVTGYDLVGVHNDVSCRECHGNSTTRRLPHATCANCHDDVHNGQFDPQPCNSCHSQTEPGWVLVDFDHDATDFPLLGEHVEVECVECHGEGVDAIFAGVDHADCDSCHEDSHDGRFEPTACSTCHGEEGWKVDDFDHDRTAFPLVGNHADAECESCHADGVWAGLPHESCGDCHDDDPHEFLGTASCSDCHTPIVDWQALIYEHGDTGFELEPQHTEAACVDCHELDRFDGLDPLCSGCHWDDRPSGHYPGSCDGCHSGPAWSPATLGDLDHSVTGFALDGSHARLECIDCHSPGESMGLASPGCVDCHADDDIHRHMLGNICEDCHTETTWLRTRFRHQQTGFSLRGAHRLAACVDCHATGYVGTPSRCVSCHERDVTLDEPAHQSAELPFCDSCHRPYTWAAVRFAH
jgi:hypothetical protein